MDFGGTSRYGSFFKKLPYRIIFLSMQKATVAYDMYPPRDVLADSGDVKSYRTVPPRDVLADSEDVQSYRTVPGGTQYGSFSKATRTPP